MKYTKEQIAVGLELAQGWYEGWKFHELEPEQIIEAIEKANGCGASATVQIVGADPHNATFACADHTTALTGDNERAFPHTGVETCCFISS